MAKRLGVYIYNGAEVIDWAGAVGGEVKGDGRLSHNSKISYCRYYVLYDV
ncbi:MAG: hypothetical protein HY265_07365 [Deltaproteobacteria bacterium]|nr:hypothetical protein [Deltaproteobacteria bacterium]